MTPSDPPPPVSFGQRVAHALGGGSGPAVARLFHRLLALIFLVAWLSLGAQIDVLIGRRGLLPLEPFLAAARAQDASFSGLPTLFLFVGGSDRALHVGIGIGIALSLAALAGLAPRFCFAIQTPLYLSYAVACRTFLGFQWDNLLLECGLLAALLPREKRARFAHVLFRVLVFKLYAESGLAKWQSPLGDWQDGSAMTFYYETAPLPTRFAHAAHARSAAWHHLESWFTLAFELALPLAIIGPRRARLAAAAVFTGFQLVNIATANYGFFAYLAIALHVFLLDDRDLLRARRALSRRAPAVRRLVARARLARARLTRCSPRRRLHAWATAALSAPAGRALRWGGAIAVTTAYGTASILEALVFFGGSAERIRDVAPLRALYAPFRVVNTYHLFAAITRERIEPEVQTLEAGEWTPHDLAHKPGDPGRAPPFVAPHQPRVDFLLWFYGLSMRRGIPPYVTALLSRLCTDPGAVAGLFPAPLPERPIATRIGFYRYHFTTPAERRATGAWWRREWVGATKPLWCTGAPPPEDSSAEF
jgi:lipase maturation factor 1